MEDDPLFILTSDFFFFFLLLSCMSFIYILDVFPYQIIDLQLFSSII